MKKQNIIYWVIYWIITIIWLFFIYIFITSSWLFYNKNYSLKCEYFLTNSEFEIWKENNLWIIKDLESINMWWIYFDKETCIWKNWIIIYYWTTWEYKKTLKYISNKKTINWIPYKIIKYKNTFK